MLLTPRAIELLADRIERAYLRRHSHLSWSGPDPRIWAVAARALLEEHRKDPSIPLDPELFVAAQPFNPPLADPWTVLAPTTAMTHYRRRIRRIVRGLHLELKAEIRQAEGRIRRGEPMETVLRSRSRSLSPLGRFIVAYRAGRIDLAERFRARAQEQHGSCPLYRLACQSLLPGEAYPVVELLPGLATTRRTTRLVRKFSIN